jgi:hypothetical protein
MNRNMGNKNMGNKNMGWLDRSVRGFLATILIYHGLVTYYGSALGIVALMLAAIVLLTVLSGFCPIYRLLGIRTNKPKRNGRLPSFH